MIFDLIYVVLGLAFLVWSADIFIDNASVTASHFGMSPLMVGMVIVGFGTSAPEMIVSAFAALDGSPGIALGNAYGSNIANIGLVLGITALVFPIAASSRIVRREIPWLLIMLLVSFGFFFDLKLSRLESIIMLLAVIIITVVSTLYTDGSDSLETEFEQEFKQDELAKESDKTPITKSILLLLFGLAVLLISSSFLVKGAVNIAEYFGVSDLIIGLTIVAIGTSLPELAASIAAARKKESDIILGNIVGSCLFNTLGVVAIAGVIKPLELSVLFLQRDFLTTVGLVLLLWFFAFGIKGKAEIGRKKGLVLLGCYLSYSIYLLMTSAVI